MFGIVERERKDAKIKNWNRWLWGNRQSKTLTSHKEKWKLFCFTKYVKLGNIDKKTVK